MFHCKDRPDNGHRREPFHTCPYKVETADLFDNEAVGHWHCDCCRECEMECLRDI